VDHQNWKFLSVEIIGLADSRVALPIYGCIIQFLSNRYQKNLKGILTGRKSYIK